MNKNNLNPIRKKEKETSKARKRTTYRRMYLDGMGMVGRARAPFKFVRWIPVVLHWCGGKLHRKPSTPVEVDCVDGDSLRDLHESSSAEGVVIWVGTAELC